MGGLAVLLLIGFYIAGASWVVKSQKSGRAKIIALVIALLIPSADAILGRIYLQHLCDTEGGLKVYRVVEGVEGFMVQGGTDGYWVKEHGYQFVEGEASSDDYYRFILKEGQLVVEEHVSPKSEFRVRFENINSDSIYGRDVHSIESIDGNEVIATNTEIFFSGGWAERFLAQFSDAGGGNAAQCREMRLYPEVSYSEFILDNLKKGN